MVDPELQQAQDRLVAATAALAHYDHVRRGRDRLAGDLAASHTRVQQLTSRLAKERNDVIERSSGVRGFLYGLIGDDQLTIEQREAIEAEARLAEAIAAHNHLQARVAALEARLAAQSPATLADAVAAARAAKEEVLVRSNHPDGIALQELAVRIEALEIELVPLDDAVAAGEAALATLRSLVATLDRARDARLEQADARGAAGAAQSAITIFQRTVDALVTADDATRHLGSLIDPADRTPFVDGWIRALVGKGDRGARLATARAAIVERLDKIEAQLAAVRARRDELAPRRERLRAERFELVG